MADDATRDRVRALVRDVLSKAAPAEFKASTPAQPAPAAPVKTPAAPAITRDESAKLVITEDDVRGLERGSVLRIAEAARLTPLAADIINERGIEITRRISRGGSKQSRTVAEGADHRGFPREGGDKRIPPPPRHRAYHFCPNTASGPSCPP